MQTSVFDIPRSGIVPRSMFTIMGLRDLVWVILGEKVLECPMKTVVFKVM